MIRDLAEFTALILAGLTVVAASAIGGAYIGSWLLTALGLPQP